MLSWLLPLVERIEDFLVGDIDAAVAKTEKELEEKAKKSQTGVAVASISVSRFSNATVNLALVLPKLSIPNLKKQFKTIIEDLDKTAEGRSPLNELARIIGKKVIVSSTSEDVMRHRKIIRSALSNKEFFELAVKHAEMLIPNERGILENSSIARYVQIVFMQGLFGLKEIPPNLAAVLEQLSLNTRPKKIFNTPMAGVTSQLSKAKKEYDKFAETVTTRAGELKDTKSPTLIDRYKKYAARENSDLSAKELNDVIQTLPGLVLAFDTTTTAIQTAVTELAKNKDLQDKIRKELIEVCSKEEFFTPAESLAHEKSFPYLHALFKEALRFSPPIPTLMRYTKKEIRTENFTVPANTIIQVKLDEMLMNSNYYKDPKEFNPERFVNPLFTESKYRLNECPLPPFSIGARRCPGSNIAALIFFTYIAKLIFRHELVFDGENVNITAMSFAKNLLKEDYKMEEKFHYGFLGYKKTLIAHSFTNVDHQPNKRDAICCVPLYISPNVRNIFSEKIPSLEEVSSLMKTHRENFEKAVAIVARKVKKHNIGQFSIPTHDQIKKISDDFFENFRKYKAKMDSPPLYKLDNEGSVIKYFPSLEKNQEALQFSMSQLLSLNISFDVNISEAKEKSQQQVKKYADFFEDVSKEMKASNIPVAQWKYSETLQEKDEKKREEKIEKWQADYFDVKIPIDLQRTSKQQKNTEDLFSLLSGILSCLPKGQQYSQLLELEKVLEEKNIPARERLQKLRTLAYGDFLAKEKYIESIENPSTEEEFIYYFIRYFDPNELAKLLSLRDKLKLASEQKKEHAKNPTSTLWNTAPHKKDEPPSSAPIKNSNLKT